MHSANIVKTSGERTIWRITASGTLLQTVTYAKVRSCLKKSAFLVLHPNIVLTRVFRLFFISILRFSRFLTAQPTHAISSSKDKNSHRNFAISLLAQAKNITCAWRKYNCTVGAI